jgi:hypothetical protein
MKTLTLNTEKPEVFRRTNKLLLTGSMLTCLTAGWFLGSLSTRAFSQSDRVRGTSDNNIILNSISVNGEALPTVMLKEFLVIADK